MKSIFRIVAFLEGVSYILLLFIAVPIKYNLGDPTYVKLLGMPHGILFVSYISIAFIRPLEKKSDTQFEEVSASNNYKKLNIPVKLIILIASIIPFGTFYVDWKYLRE